MKTYKSNCPELKAELRRGEVKKAQIKSSTDAANFFRDLWEGIDISACNEAGDYFDEVIKPTL